MKNLFLNLVFIFLLTICESQKCPDPPINCLLCNRCKENEIKIRSPCGCCYDKCIPNPIVCSSNNKTVCTCIASCPKNQTLAESPCGCCYNYCVSNRDPIISPEPECPLDICLGFKCPVPECINGAILVEGAGYCGCCPGCVSPKTGDKCYTEVNTGLKTCGASFFCCNGTCQPKFGELQCINREPIIPPKSNCPPDICEIVDCALPECKNGTILVDGAGYCGCCPGCVTPKNGDKCYTEVNTGMKTCGDKLSCCNGTCQFNGLLCLDDPCRNVRCPLIPAKCPSGEILARPRGQCCPRCLAPKNGDKCYTEAYTGLETCGDKLICCNGTCQSKFSDVLCPGDLCSRVLCSNLPIRCPNGEVLAIPEGQCCLSCMKPPSSVCLEDNTICKRCIASCPENYFLVKSPCGCCQDYCALLEIDTSPGLGCPPGICQSVKCSFPECKNGTILVEGASGTCRCCPGCVTSKIGDNCYTAVTTGLKTCGDKLVCCNGTCQQPNFFKPCIGLECPGICQSVKCSFPECKNGTILVEEASGICRCCPGCVTPKIGDKCYTEVTTGLKTCGDRLVCCNGTCQQPKFIPCSDNPCDTVRCLTPAKCPSGEILATPRGQCCPRCVKPMPGDRCYLDQSMTSTCGPDLICCRNGICARNLSLCGY